MHTSWRTATAVALQFLAYSLVAAGVYYSLSDASVRGSISLGLGAGLAVTLVSLWLRSRD